MVDKIKEIFLSQPLLIIVLGALLYFSVTDSSRQSAILLKTKDAHISDLLNGYVQERDENKLFFSKVIKNQEEFYERMLAEQKNQYERILQFYDCKGSK